MLNKAEGISNAARKLPKAAPPPTKRNFRIRVQILGIPTYGTSFNSTSLKKVTSLVVALNDTQGFFNRHNTSNEVGAPNASVVKVSERRSSSQRYNRDSCLDP